jgi:hypothetical protein
MHAEVPAQCVTGSATGGQQRPLQGRAAFFTGLGNVSSTLAALAAPEPSAADLVEQRTARQNSLSMVRCTDPLQIACVVLTGRE